MFRKSERKGVLLFLVSLFCVGVCYGGDFSLFLEELKHAEKVISDTESKCFLVSVLKNPELLKKDYFKKRAMLLYRRALLVMKLDSILFSGSIKDKEIKKKIERWLDNQILLDDPQIRQEAKILIKYAEAGFFEIQQELSPSDGNAEKVIKYVGLPLYALFRKFRFLKNLDNGTLVSAREWYFDFFVSMMLDSMPNLHQDGIHIRSGIDVLHDDISLFVERKALREGVSIQQVGPDIQLHGCQQKVLGFSYLFDSYVDHFVEKFLSDNCAGDLQKHEVSRFIRRVLLYKFLPTYLYWLAREWFEEPRDQTQANILRDQQIAEKRRRFSTYVPFKEAVKSSGKSLEYKLSDLLTNHFNGNVDKDGKGDLERARDYTLGVVGPDLVSLGLKLAMPRAMIAATNKVGLGGQGAFLSADDYFSPGDRDWVQHMKKESISHTIRSIFFYCLPKVFRTYRPKVCNWAWTKMKKFLGFLERRGWISGWFMPEIDKSVGFALFPLFLELISCRLNMRMTRFEFKETWKEIMKTDDMWRILDYYMAFWIGSWLGKKAAG